MNYENMTESELLAVKQAIEAELQRRKLNESDRTADDPFGFRKLIESQQESKAVEPRPKLVNTDGMPSLDLTETLKHFSSEAVAATDSTMELFKQKVREYKTYLQNQQSAEESQIEVCRDKENSPELQASEADRHADTNVKELNQCQ